MRAHSSILLVLACILGFVGGLIGSAVGSFLMQPSDETRIREFYATENAVHVSPHGLRKKMAKGTTDYILVDLRSREEYEQEHIVGAVSIPAYSDKDTPAYEEEERIVEAFRALPHGGSIIVYCYSIPCMTGRKIGKMLTEHGIYVQHLGIGWNEWRHFWKLWNHEHEWETTQVEDFIAHGSEPGIPKVTDISPCTEGSYGC